MNTGLPRHYRVAYLTFSSGGMAINTMDVAVRLGELVTPHFLVAYINEMRRHTGVIVKQENILSWSLFERHPTLDEAFPKN